MVDATSSHIGMVEWMKKNSGSLKEIAKFCFLFTEPFQNITAETNSTHEHYEYKTPLTHILFIRHLFASAFFASFFSFRESNDNKNRILCGTTETAAAIITTITKVENTSNYYAFLLVWLNAATVAGWCNPSPVDANERIRPNQKCP